jgi:hypothetical protein
VAPQATTDGIALKSYSWINGMESSLKMMDVPLKNGNLTGKLIVYSPKTCFFSSHV